MPGELVSSSPGMIFCCVDGPRCFDPSPPGGPLGSLHIRATVSKAAETPVGGSPCGPKRSSHSAKRQGAWLLGRLAEACLILRETVTPSSSLAASVFIPSSSKDGSRRAASPPAPAASVSDSGHSVRCKVASHCLHGAASLAWRRRPVSSDGPERDIPTLERDRAGRGLGGCGPDLAVWQGGLASGPGD